MQELYAIVCLLFINYVSSQFAADCNVEGCTECRPDGLCNLTCNDGYTGLSCDKCGDRYYLDGKACKPCRKECISCTSDYKCNECIDGRYGQYCQYSCSNNCRQNKCDKRTGKCTEGCIAKRYGDDCGDTCSIGCDGQCNQHDGNCICKDEYTGTTCDKCDSGYYLYDKTCRICLKQCISCTSQYECNECTDGRYGQYCQYSCSNNCRQNKCDKRTGKCTEGCIAKRYGDDCRDTCSIGCDGQCNQHDGNCTCKDGYTGTTCDKCDSGYYLYDKTCRICLKQCISCTSQYECNECTDGRYGQYCQYSCSNNCRQNKCDKRTGKCTEGCIAKRYGDDCRDTCSIGCDGQCNQHDGNCTCKDGYTGTTCDKCDGGYYLYDKTCRICLKQCISCTSQYECNECTDGRYGQYCQYSCSNNCRQNKCDKRTGKCTEGCIAKRYGDDCRDTCSIGCDGQCNQHDGNCTCKDGYTGTTCDKCDSGYYLYDKTCRICLKQCISCTSQYECNECIDRRWGKKCQYQCSNYCRQNKCDKGTGKCTEGCIAKRYGDDCGYTCSIGCDRQCNQHDGTCTCKDGYEGTTCKHCGDGYYLDGKTCKQCLKECISCTSYYECNECRDGRHGQYCQYSCSNNCRQNKCDKRTGKCTEGCIAKRYGDDCGDSCSIGCDGQCNQHDGTCTCKDGYEGSQCETCIDHWYKNGQNCTQCSYGCHDQCNDYDGTCNCKDGYEGRKCNQCNGGWFKEGVNCMKCPISCKQCYSKIGCISCRTGYYGSRCDLSCPPGCENGCDKNTGSCSSCKDGYSGDRCCVQSKGCRQCSTDSVCKICTQGFYGTNCEQTCPIHCSDSCNKETGQCTSCTDGYFGFTCNTPCPVNCLACAQNGTCTLCKEGFYGDACDNTCLENCRNCTNENHCLSCIDGFYGSTCTSECPVNCVACFHDKYCFKCKDGFTSWNKCKYNCSKKCKSCKIDNKYECTACAHGFYPDNLGKCVTCSDKCNSNTCDATDGTCIEGCIKGYWGKQCSFNCPDLCLECDKNDGLCNVCEEGRFKRNCSVLCTDRCLSISGSLTCDIDTGACKHGCSNTSRYGDFCDKNCSHTCVDTECDWKTSGCAKGCVAQFFGLQCQNKCSTNCISILNKSRCFDNNGSCIFGCLDGYYGAQCEQKCGENCANGTCSRQTGGCTQGCISGYEGKLCIQALNQSEKAGYIGLIIGAISSVVVATILVLVLVCIIRRKKKRGKEIGENEPVDSTKMTQGINKKTKGKSAVSPTYERHELCIPGPSNINLPEAYKTPLHEIAGPSGETYYNAGAITRTRVTVDMLADYVSSKSKDDLVNEFKTMPRNLYKPYKDSQKPGNTERNRYKEIYPYDFNRVKLQVRKGKSNYINASYIDGFQNQKEYIAALGPTKTETEDFKTTWRMLWQQQVEKIVMLTNLVENGKMKCHQYWPHPNTTVVYDDVNVRCLSEETYAEFTVRTFTVEKEKEKRVLTQFHFTAWPDRGVPDDVTGLLEFRYKVQSIKSKYEGPIVVHCSAGVGRTGTYIAIDYLTKEGEETGSVDVLECVSNLRGQRILMVQTEEQYVYIHDAIVHSLTFDSKPIPSDIYLDYLTTLDEGSLSSQFQMLNSCHVRSDEEEEEAIRRNNAFIGKNQPNADIPGNRYRPKLHMCRTFGDSDYINAIYINAYKERNRYIVTQTPLVSTVLDFVALLFQERVTCIIDMEPDKKEISGQYLSADNQTSVHGEFEISSKRMNTRQHYIERRITVKWNNKDRLEERTCSHYQYTAWNSETNTPSSACDFVDFVKLSESTAKQYSSDGTILIHCMSGAKRSCLLCAVSVIIQKMETEHQVSMVNVVRQIKSRRKTTIHSQEQLLFCHQCIGVFLEAYSDYSNFS